MAGGRRENQAEITEQGVREIGARRRRQRVHQRRERARNVHLTSASALLGPAFLLLVGAFSLFLRSTLVLLGVGLAFLLRLIWCIGCSYAGLGAVLVFMGVGL